MEGKIIVIEGTDCSGKETQTRLLVDKLTKEEREIVILHVVNGFKFHEIAKLLNLKLSTTLSKYHRAIKRIKEIVKEESI